MAITRRSALTDKTNHVQPYLRTLIRDVKREWLLYLILLPVIANFIIFHYIPIYGLQVAFKQYNIVLGIMKSPWVGLENFVNFFTAYNFVQITLNTLLVSLYLIILGFPLPIVFALLLNEVRFPRLRKTFQTISYLPNFVSAVVVVGMINQFFNQTGPVNQLMYQCCT